MMEEIPEWMTKTDFPFRHRRGIQAINEAEIDGPIQLTQLNLARIR